MCVINLNSKTILSSSNLTSKVHKLFAKVRDFLITLKLYTYFYLTADQSIVYLKLLWPFFYFENVKN